MSLCIYHGDLDGHTSAAIIDKKYLINKFVVANYDTDFPFDRVKRNESVFIVDYSLKNKDDMNRLLNITKKVIWIDHHITAIQKFDGFKYLEGIRKDTYPAACMLCWQFCFPATPPPKFVSIVADYDVWKYEFGDLTRNVVTAAQEMENTHPRNSDFWYPVLEGDSNILTEMKINGEKIRLVKSINRKSFVKSHAFRIEFEGMSVIACNKQDGGSLLFDGLDDIDKYDAMMSFQYSGVSDLWEVSLYSTNDEIDCGCVAKKYGGGGHRGAAGFSVKVLPFEII